MSTALAKRRGPSKPMCARCHRLVDSFEEHRDDHIGRLVFTAKCHGRVERVSLDETEVRSLRRVEFGEAFRTP